MEICTFIEPQNGASYDEQLAFALATEQLGFHGFFRSDHFLAFEGDGLPGPSDTWVVLAGLARDTSRIRLGTLVSAATFRHPSVLAIQVANIDAMSGGRIELGLGAGWNDKEHRAYGIPFPARRFGILEEQLAIVTGLWGTPAGETFDFAGGHYVLDAAPALPRTTQERIPLIVGGGGPTRTPALAAAYATEYNYFWFDASKDPAARFAQVGDAAEAIGRARDTLRYSLVLSLGASEMPLDEITRRLDAAHAAGADRVYLQFLDHRDLDYLERVATLL
ncbi:LLM class F420-dependent oxidoreductase [Microbacterium sediminicola]|uniref:LLM class F420-dependent oxidoreductase n=1 Tax=Microbacterium sediminicola TaxID=415210 RepID=A0ABN2IE40_9MICO